MLATWGLAASQHGALCVCSIGWVPCRHRLGPETESEGDKVIDKIAKIFGMQGRGKEGNVGSRRRDTLLAPRQRTTLLRSEMSRGLGDPRQLRQMVWHVAEHRRTAKAPQDTRLAPPMRVRGRGRAGNGMPSRGPMRVQPMLQNHPG